MSALLADTSFFVAYLNSRDAHYERAKGFMLTRAEPVVTTQWVLAELGNYLAETKNRRLFATLVRELYKERRFEIVSADDHSFQLGLDLFARRPDKQWSFTDCVSFRLMKQRKIHEALTSDHHFEQAGFVALLK
jgi:uncharacterized protein